MPSTNDVAVIICTRDRPVLLRNALDAVDRSRIRDVEVIVVDSGSKTWSTRDVVMSSGYRFVRSDISGLSIARNIGLHSTTRPIVVYTDDDCEATEGWIDRLLEHFQDPKVGAVTGRMLDHTLVGRDEITNHAPRRFTRASDGIDAGHGALMAFRRDVLVDLGGFDEVLGAGRKPGGAEDLDMLARVLRARFDVVYDPSSVMLHMFTRDDRAFSSLHRGYGIGLGAMANKWIRLDFRIGVAMLIRVAGRSIRRAFRQVRDPRQFRASAASVAGIVEGVFYAIPMKVERGRFIDSAPPAAVVATNEPVGPR